ncbi:M18 family aminopeptidase [Helicovermis profundi]|uniref:M18 family aminopeptidase n=1 Tax=Helicovermis profundi TaxID=3065157 RepID=A0AAU9EGF2_9FIRM|nr:M18 family aminopeptidase [Clostridia bacterium S502]
MKKNSVKEFVNYIDIATTPIQAVSHSIDILKNNGFEQLNFNKKWNLVKGNKYFIRPYSTSLVAFSVGSEFSVNDGLKIITSHTDTPTYKIKPNPEINSSGYLKLNTEVYGGPIFNSWFDRPISLAGQIVLKSDNIFEPKIVEIDFRKPLLIIPSLAIHFNRKVNKGVEVNPQKDLLPLMKTIEKDFETKNYLMGLLAEQAGCEVDEILDFDLYLYVTEKAETVGLTEEFISSPRIDNLSMVFSSFEALINSKNSKGINIAVGFDNEEIGSTTKQGADSTIFRQIVERILLALEVKEEDKYNLFNKSFMISADGAHAVHPNVIEKNDITNFPLVNSGIAVKVSAKQSYATDSISSAIFSQICEKADVPFQKFVNRSDEPGGKTLGPIAGKYLPIKTIDVGLPMLSMHSARELMGAKDLIESIKIFKTFFEL